MEIRPFMNVWAFLAFTALLFLISRVFYHLFLNPLRKVPGPFFARFTNLWELCTIHRSNFNEKCVELHKKYGPVVRLAPNRYSINTIDSVKTIYALRNGFPKSEWYDAFGHPSARNLLNVRNEKDHTTRKRLLASLYSMSTAVHYEEQVNRINKILTRKFREYANGRQRVTMTKVLQYYAFDVIAQITMDVNFGMIDAEKDTLGLLETIEQANDYPMYIGLYSHLHPFLFSLGDFFGAPNPFATLTKIVDRQIKIYKTKYADLKQHSDNSCQSFLSKLFSLHETGQVDRQAISDSCGMNIIAGSDTTSVTMGACLFYLYHTPRALKQLREELDTSKAQGLISDPITFAEAQKLPYLQALLQETLRMHPAVGQILARSVPNTGAEMEGYHFPPGTEVGVNAWALHRNPALFPDPDVFQPERWLEEGTGSTKKADKLLAFGGGTRTCIGRHISLLEINKVVPQIVQNFELVFEDSNSSLNSRASWFVVPKYECILQERSDEV
ncbi:uncharacterized protein JN550_012824 [Neoarthrinium moseri]|uniref:uncharacterized protein n=1 Tax=Neoarthrinium moseri TaxID=1658444 RepID=UPI001FDC4BDE|nr:uncharacterized protein JN550_012824 [Neoarthrinium moseri]KAI1858293.1 hypothetical protein JN550_012824 [Neoarthrinium moseri]